MRKSDDHPPGISNETSSVPNSSNTSILGVSGVTSISDLHDGRNTSSASTASSSSTSPTTPTTKSVLHLKPTITVVPSDSDKIIESLRIDRNVVVPVIALVCAPLLVLLLLLIHKRYQETRGNSYYQRMGFLIEDIYND